MTITRTTIRLHGGRDIDVLLGGAETDLGLVVDHGTRGEATRYASWNEAASARGLRLVGFSRPGYATSSRLPGRDVAAVIPDVAAILDEVGVRKFVTMGGSGGGPHSIACAALMPGRCSAAAALVTIAPSHAPGLDWLEGMAQVNVDEFGAALRGEEPLRAWMEATGAQYRNITGPQILTALGDALPPVDQRILTTEWAERAATGMRRALGDGFDGWVDDDLAFTRPWGFDLAAIRVPVRVWQGELDRLVPVSHGRWLADRIPGARFELASGHGHFSLGETHRDAILDALVMAA